MDEDEDVKNALTNYRTVAIVGLSGNPSRYSQQVAEFLQSRGWKIVPVNPFVDEVLGEKSHKSLSDLPDNLQKIVGVVDIFRKSQDVPPIVDQAIQLRRKNGKPDIMWMQLGIVNEEAAAEAREAGLIVIMDRCMKVEIERIEKGK